MATKSKSRAKDRRVVAYLDEDLPDEIKKVREHVPELRSDSRLINIAIRSYCQQAMKYGIDFNFMPLIPEAHPPSPPPRTQARKVG